MNLNKWKIIHCLAVSTGLIIFHTTRSIFPVLMLVSLSIIGLWISQWQTISHIKPAGGYANLVTMFRFLCIILISSFSGMLQPVTIGILFIIPVSMDALDGFLARKLQNETRFGAIFDMETDSVFVALAGLILFDRHLAGVWLLPAVYMRYIYVMILFILKLNEKPEKRTHFGPFIAVFMFAGLIAGFILPAAIGLPVLCTSSVLVILSFGYSFANVNGWIT